MPHISTVEAQWLLAQPSAADLVVAARLRYASRLLNSGPASLVALVQATAGKQWRQQLQDAFSRMRQALLKKLAAMPLPTSDLMPWQQLMRQVGWKHLIRCCLKRPLRSRFQRRIQEPPATATISCAVCVASALGPHPAS